ncbi:MAG: flagellar export protein FliJ [Rhodospirillales bacterium]|nr:flagellar export protein FliJ [Rhodospirillales bacterium]
MAKNLNTLIRLNEWTVDERRRELGQVLRALVELEVGLERLRREVINEQNAAMASPEEAGFFYGNYARAVIDRRQTLNDGIRRMEAQVAAARERLNEAYRELKKFEVAQKTRDQREARELARREQGVLDDIGLTLFRLKQG